jgi:hypothetical protein
MNQNHSEINLETIDKQFEYEKYARLIDESSCGEVKDLAKSYLKLYLMQQECISKLSVSFDK